MQSGAMDVRVKEQSAYRPMNSGIFFFFLSFRWIKILQNQLKKTPLFTGNCDTEGAADLLHKAWIADMDMLGSV